MNNQLEAILKAKQDLPSPMDADYAEKHYKLQTAVGQLLQQIGSEGLFSSNEEADDIATNSLKYLSIWFIFGEVLDAARVDPDLDRVVGRMLILHSSVRAYLNFMGVLLDYGLLATPLISFYKAVNGQAQFDLEAAPVTGREQKIQMYSLTKAARELWLEQRENVLSDRDEEAQRGALLAKLGYESAEAMQNIVNNIQELELLASMAQLERSVALKEGKLSMTEATLGDMKKADLSTRVEVEPGANQIGGPLVGKRGKVLRPFTLTRGSAASQVLGTGQVLPSMSVEEFVDQELKNGGMVQPKEEEKEDDEDDPDFQDRETERLRRWDDFTDANPKGSGNTMNLG